jgi:hypothetical protein
MSKQNGNGSQELDGLQAEAARQETSEFHHADIQARAYKLWVSRGCPGDSADEDWFLAAKQLRDSRK